MLTFKQRTPPTSRQALTASQKRFQRIYLDAIKETQKQITRDEGLILDAIQHRSITYTIGLISDEPWYEAQEKMQEELLAELIDGGKRVRLPTMVKAVMRFRFDAARPEAAAWAGKEAGNLIREVTQAQIDVVRDLASRAAMGEFTGVQVGRMLRDHIGLTQMQAGWVDNFRDRTFSSQIGQGRSFADAMARTDSLTDRYADRIHRYRSEMIARTEILRASHEGRRQAWGQGIQEGYISPNDRKYWSANDDDRICEDCSSISAQYDKENAIPINDDFELGEPPVHPMCRCDVILLPESPDADLAAMTTEQLDSELDALLSGQQSTPANSVGIQSMPDELPKVEREAWIKSNVDSTFFNGRGNAAVQEAYESYSRLYYDGFNNALRNGVDVDRYRERITNLRNGIMNSEPLKSDLRVWRGVKGRGEFAETLQNIPVGGRITDAGFMSTSASKKVGFEFGGRRGIVLEIEAPKGSNAIMGKAAAEEAEIIFPPSSTIQIVSRRVEMFDGVERTVITGRLIQ